MKKKIVVVKKTNTVRKPSPNSPVQRKLGKKIVDTNAETKRIVLRPIRKEVYRANRISIDVQREVIRLNNIIKMAENIKKNDRLLSIKDQDMVARRINKLIKFANTRAKQQVELAKKDKDIDYYNRGKTMFNEVLELILITNKLELMGIVSKGFGKKAGIYLE